jgi:hypothetical protein
MLDWVIAPQSRPFIFIRWGGLAPAGVEILTNLVLKYNYNSVYKAWTPVKPPPPPRHSTRPIQWRSPNYF